MVKSVCVLEAVHLSGFPRLQRNNIENKTHKGVHDTTPLIYIQLLMNTGLLHLLPQATIAENNYLNKTEYICKSSLSK